VTRHRKPTRLTHLGSPTDRLFDKAQYNLAHAFSEGNTTMVEERAKRLAAILAADVVAIAGSWTG